MADAPSAGVVNWQYEEALQQIEDLFVRDDCSSDYSPPLMVMAGAQKQQQQKLHQTSGQSQAVRVEAAAVAALNEHETVIEEKKGAESNGQ